jgi:type II secretory ATPase GspE/PulE/Tfp pilus assembly ATPase PilB-like protein/CheY-like chemotaxis protein
VTGSASALGGIPDAWLTQILADTKLLTEDQARALATEPGVSVWATAVARGWTTDAAIVLAIATGFRLKAADVEKAEGRYAILIPESLARKLNVVPISADERRIVVATADPRDYAAEQALSFVTGRTVEFQIAAPETLREKLDEMYRPERSIERLLHRLEPASVETIDEISAPESGDPGLDQPVARLVDAMISDAVREGASDIHAEPEEHATVVRYRVDGVLREVMRLPAAAGAALVRRVKILARLDITDPLHPHDGRAAIRVDGHPVDLRVSTVPIARRGEKVVVRILDSNQLRASLADLGLSEHELALVNRLLGFREGMLLVTGPTGSGKTTTLYAALNQLKTGKVNIVTVEDPVEYDLPGISQIQVSEVQGLTFATVLRSVLRQDPDIVLVGEIRDQETATTAIQAGLSGHYVLSTLHTNDAASAVVRLRDMGVDSFKIASVLRGVLAQRLVRKLCPECAADTTVDILPPEARPPEAWNTSVRIRRAVGCKKCNGVGYKGRLSVMEILPVDESVARLIGSGQPPDIVAAAARKLGMHSLWESGLERAWQGLTTLEELVRVLGERVEEDGSTAPGRASVATVPPSVRSPMTQPAAEAPAGAMARPPGAPGEAGATVLLADDDQQMRRLVRGVLEREGFTVLEASDGIEALDSLAQHAVDLLILDHDMPRLNGLGVLEELRHGVATAGLPVVMLTARTDSTETEALDLGAQDYLTKPIRPSALSARVRAVLRRVRT